MHRRYRFAPALATTALGLAALAGTSGDAAAVSLSVQRACMGDYLSHCSQHAIGSSAVRSCMSKAGPKLSGRCISALMAAGEVSKAEVQRRRAASQ